MTVDPTKRDSSWRMIQPGLYIDPDGYGHAFPDEICAVFGWPYDEYHYELILKVFREMMPVPVTIIKHQREADA